MDVRFELNFDFDSFSMLFNGELVVLDLGLDVVEVFEELVSKTRHLLSDLFQSQSMILSFIIHCRHLVFHSLFRIGYRGKYRSDGRFSQLRTLFSGMSIKRESFTCDNRLPSYKVERLSLARRGSILIEGADKKSLNYIRQVSSESV